MTVILVDAGDNNHDLQLSNHGWDCLVTNLSHENIFDAHTIEMLGIPIVGTLNSSECKIFSKAITDKLISRLSDGEVLFHDGSIGTDTPPKVGYSLNTPYHLVSSLSKETLGKIASFSNKCTGLNVL